MAELTQQYSQQSSANLTGVVRFRIIAEYQKFNYFNTRVPILNRIYLVSLDNVVVFDCPSGFFEIRKSEMFHRDK